LIIDPKFSCGGNGLTPPVAEIKKGGSPKGKSAFAGTPSNHPGMPGLKKPGLEPLAHVRRRLEGEGRNPYLEGGILTVGGRVVKGKGLEITNHKAVVGCLLSVDSEGYVKTGIIRHSPQR
jgi:hypothetical protein